MPTDVPFPAPGLIARSRAHLGDAGLDYWSHLGVAIGIGGAMLGAGAACLVHGFLPGLFTDKASSAVAVSIARSSATTARQHGAECPFWNMRSSPP